MKEEAKKAGLPAGEAQAKSPGGAGENGTPKTPTSGKKRGAKGDANEGTPSKSAKKGKKGAQGEVAVKAEEGNEEAV